MRVFASVPQCAWAVLIAAAITAHVCPAVADPFTSESVRKLAAETAAKPFVRPSDQLPASLQKLSYDQFRDIRFKPEQAIWRGDNLGFELHLLPVGWLFKTPIALHLVEKGQVRRIDPNPAYFDVGKLASAVAPTDIGFSGFRLNGLINRPDKMDEIIVFQGASYFRAVSQGQGYGLSARGLAIDTAEPKGEEFPFFRTFWIERPEPGATSVVIHALLDSPSVAGAYTFRVRGGAPTDVDVDAVLYPRKTLDKAGLAPLTSMFLFGPSDARLLDYRPSVHDSDALAIIDGDGERIWRPLTNPKRLQFSAFVAENPRGFGLVQRSRRAEDFQDLEARYERRPTGWVEPTQPWGHGSVVLIEIPTDEEIHDNIVAFWRPNAPLEAGKPYALSYRLSWPDEAPMWSGARVHRTSTGLAIGPQRKQGVVQFVVDFTGQALGQMEKPAAVLTTTAGQVTPAVVQSNPINGGVRVSFLLDPKGAELAELRLVLRNGERDVSEVWLYRWVK